MERPPQLILQYLTELEQQAEDLLSERRQIIDLDRRRQKTREAIRALQKDSSEAKTWMCVNNMFIKLPKSNAQSLLKQASTIERVKRKIRVTEICNVPYYDIKLLPPCWEDVKLLLASRRASDFDHLDVEITELRDGLKVKVDKLRDTEDKDELKGFHLSALSKQELDAINSIL